MENNAPPKPTARVLIVDDEEPVRMLTERVLRRAGYQTAVAADGAEALRIVAGQDPFDLLLADVVMPEMHGDELARRLLRREPDLKVLYVTGYSEQLFTDRTTLGANEAFLEKPITTRGLVEAVSLALSGQTHYLASEPLPDLTSVRNPRMETAAIPVRVGDAVGRLVNVSTTGALVHLPQTLAPASQWPMRIEWEPHPVDLQVLVVRSHTVSVSLPEGMWQHPQYAVAVAFIELEAGTREALHNFCTDGKHE